MLLVFPYQRHGIFGIWHTIVRNNMRIRLFLDLKVEVLHFEYWWYQRTHLVESNLRKLCELLIVNDNEYSAL